MQEADTQLPGEPTSPRQARHFVDAVLTSWGLETASAAVTLLVSELVTNAVLHARTGCAVRIAYDGGSRLRVEVSDGSPAAPSRRHYSEQSATGRGLALVEALSDDWGVDATPDGKVVWFLVDPLAAAGGEDTERAARTTDARGGLARPRPKSRRPGRSVDRRHQAAA